MWYAQACVGICLFTIFIITAQSSTLHSAQPCAQDKIHKILQPEVSLLGYFQHNVSIILLSLSQSLHCMKQITDFSFCRPKHQRLKNCSHYESTSALYLYRKTCINQSIVWHPYCVQSTAGSSKVLKMPSTAIVSIPARLRLGALIPTLYASSSSSSRDCPILIFFNFFWGYKVVWSF